MNIRLVIFKYTVDDCINFCYKCLERNGAYKNIEEQNQIKEVILPELIELKKVNKYTVLPPTDRRYIESFAYAFKVWNWDMRNPSKLYKKLIKINNLYKTL